MEIFVDGVCQTVKHLMLELVNGARTNPHMYEQVQLMEMSAVDIIAGGNSSLSARQIAANKLLDKVFKIRFGRGFYGECLGVRIDGSSDLIDEIGKELSRRSAAAGLREIEKWCMGIPLLC